MPEIDLRGGPLSSGFPREEQFISRELYYLLAIFSASPKLAQLRQSLEGGCVYGWSIRSFEYPEVGRILLGIASMVRNDWDADPGRIESILSMLHPNDGVGVLVPDLARPANFVSLTLRESLNKILHAQTINLDRSEGPSIYHGHLNPRVFLYGDKSGALWKATLEIYSWAEKVHSIV